MNAVMQPSRISIVPKNREDWLALRTNDITSTEVSALFGISPYITAYGLWHAKSGQLDMEFEENARMVWGTRLQDAIAAGICTDQGWKGWKKDEYIRLPEYRIGCSFDWETTHGLLEIKNVDSLQHREQWQEIDGQVEAPVHIEMQLQHQMLVSGVQQGTIGALIGGNRVQLLHRKADAAIHALILKKVAAFWRSIDANVEPEMVFPADAAVVARLYNYADPGSVLNLHDDAGFATLVQEYTELGKEIKTIEAQRDERKARILMAIGSAEKAYSGRYTVTAGMVSESEISYTRKAYRNFRVTSKKGES